VQVKFEQTDVPLANPSLKGIKITVLQRFEWVA